MNITLDTTMIGISRRMTIAIDGLGYGGRGWQVVEQALAQEAGVSYVYVDGNTEMAYVVYNPHLCDPYTLVAAVERAGFHAEAPEHH